MPTPPSTPALIFENPRIPRPQAAKLPLGSVYLSPTDGVFISDGEAWNRVEYSSDIPETASKSPSEMAELVATSLRTFVPDVGVTVEGSCITVTSLPAQTLLVSVTESPTEPPLIKVDVTPREAGEAWGDYAARIEANPPGADRETWIAGLRALAGE